MSLLQVTTGGLARDIIVNVTTLDITATGKCDINIYHFLVIGALSLMEAPCLLCSLKFA